MVVGLLGLRQRAGVDLQATEIREHLRHVEGAVSGVVAQERLYGVDRGIVVLEVAFELELRVAASLEVGHLHVVVGGGSQSGLADRQLVAVARTEHRVRNVLPVFGDRLAGRGEVAHRHLRARHANAGLLVVDVVLGDLGQLGCGFRELLVVEVCKARFASELVGAASAELGCQLHCGVPERVEERVVLGQALVRRNGAIERVGDVATHRHHRVGFFALLAELRQSVAECDDRLEAAVGATVGVPEHAVGVEAELRAFGGGHGGDRRTQTLDGGFVLRLLQVTLADFKQQGAGHQTLLHREDVAEHGLGAHSDVVGRVLVVDALRHRERLLHLGRVAGLGLVAGFGEQHQVAVGVADDFKDTESLFAKLGDVGAEVGEQLVGAFGTFARHGLTSAHVDFLHHAEQELLHFAAELQLALEGRVQRNRD